MYYVFGCTGSLSLHGLFPSCRGQVLAFIVVCGLLAAVTSCCGAQAPRAVWASGVMSRGLQ